MAVQVNVQSLKICGGMIFYLRFWNDYVVS
jgi:hypothetical protein